MPAALKAPRIAQLQSSVEVTDQNRDLTVQRLFEECFKRHWSKPQYQKSGWAKEVQGLYKRHIAPKFSTTVVVKLRASTIRNWHDDMNLTPTTANRALEVLSKLYRFAQEREWIEQGHNPCQLVKSFTEKKRRRYASKEELEKIGRLLEAESKTNPCAVAFLYILIYSGARPRSIERATREDLEVLDVDGQTYGVLTFEGKGTHQTGEQETVILPPQAMKVLEKLPRNLKTLTGIQMPKGIWNRIRKEAGCEDLWARDFRRTFATIGLSNGAGIGVIGELLNHRTIQTTTVYAKLIQDKKIETVKNISDKIAQLMKGTK